MTLQLLAITTASGQARLRAATSSAEPPLAVVA
jgi:hypothetical protein